MKYSQQVKVKVKFQTLEAGAQARHRGEVAGASSCCCWLLRKIQPLPALAVSHPANLRLKGGADLPRSPFHTNVIKIAKIFLRGLCISPFRVSMCVCYCSFSPGGAWNSEECLGHLRKAANPKIPKEALDCNDPTPQSSRCVRVQPDQDSIFSLTHTWKCNSIAKAVFNCKATNPIQRQSLTSPSRAHVFWIDLITRCRKGKICPDNYGDECHRNVYK